MLLYRDPMWHSFFFFFHGRQRHFKLQIAHWVFNRSIFQFCYFHAPNQTSSLMSPVLFVSSLTPDFSISYICYYPRNPILLFPLKWGYQNWLCIICCQFNNILIFSLLHNVNQLLYLSSVFNPPWTGTVKSRVLFCFFFLSVLVVILETSNHSLNYSLLHILYSSKFPFILIWKDWVHNWNFSSHLLPLTQVIRCCVHMLLFCS